MKPATAPVTTKRSSGYSMIEVLIVVGVIGILGAIAMPSYFESVRKARRADAKLILTDTAQRLERCYAECNAYNAGSCPAACPTLTSPINSTEGFYQITTGAGSAIAASTFTLVAVPVAGKSQASDAGCTSFTITHLNVKTAAGSSAATCWTK